MILAESRASPETARESSPRRGGHAPCLGRDEPNALPASAPAPTVDTANAVRDPTPERSLRCAKDAADLRSSRGETRTMRTRASSRRCRIRPQEKHVRCKAADEAGTSPGRVHVARGARSTTAWRVRMQMLVAEFAQREVSPATEISLIRRGCARSCGESALRSALERDVSTSMPSRT